MSHILVPPLHWRTLLVDAYTRGERSWDEVFKELFNAGWRKPTDRHGFPARLWRGPLLLSLPKDKEAK